MGGCAAWPSQGSRQGSGRRAATRRGTIIITSRPTKRPIKMKKAGDACGARVEGPSVNQCWGSVSSG